MNHQQQTVIGVVIQSNKQWMFHQVQLRHSCNPLKQQSLQYFTVHIQSINPVVLRNTTLQLQYNIATTGLLLPCLLVKHEPYLYTFLSLEMQSLDCNGIVK